MKVLIIANEHDGYSTVKAICKRECVVSTVEGSTRGNPYICFRKILKELAEKVGLPNYLDFTTTVAHVTCGNL